MKNKEDVLYEAKVSAVKLLGKYSYTYKGMVDKLCSKGYDEDIALEVAEHYKELGYLDDYDYAVKFINDAVTFKYYGMERIRFELLQKGVDEYVIEDAFANLDIDFTECLKKLLENRASDEVFNDVKKKNKLIAFLRRKGFDFEEITRAINEYLE